MSRLSSSQHTTRPGAAFTLIELLVVIAIIAILAGLLLTGIGKARAQGKLQRARNDVHSFTAAFRSMESEYGRYPYWDEIRRPVNRDLVQILSGLYNVGTWENLNWQTRPYNIRERVYMEIPLGATNSAGEYLDPWGTPYQVVFDGNNDGAVTNPFLNGVLLRIPLVVWSKGPDMTNDFAGESSARNRDNIKNY